MLTAKETREAFKTFFESKGHHIVPSAPMVIKDDPTLMFTNAGMNQFKDIILGNRPAKYKRVADSQKCLRVSGKHNDLEEVGHDTYHHTMFEMLGNWSFGDYFKKEAIAWAWEFLVDVLRLSPERLYATVFEGEEKEGLSRDNEAATYWEQYLPETHILNGNKHDNFWEMGDTGPCGPCSEIHIDLRTEAERREKDGRELINKDHPQVIEIWNLVFMQYNRMADGHLEPLPAKVIDTGMGFERLCMALQGKTSNYDTDVFQPLIHAVAASAGIAYGSNEKSDIAMRVIADHVRTIAFSIADGQLPSNAKAGYVIRRILRRAVRYGYTFLHKRTAFMHHLIPVLVESMGEAYPEIAAQQTLITKVMKEEEEAFLRTLENGIKLLEKVTNQAKEAGKSVISGRDAFTLYDTFGFPLDLTELILREQGMKVDTEAFDREMQAQKQRARQAATVEADDWVILKEGTTRFVGYDDTTCTGVEILKYRAVKEKKQTRYELVLSQTPFYAESGGQIGDTGVLQNAEGSIRIVDTKKENNLPIHIAEQLPKDVKGPFTAIIDLERRKACMANHTATHLLDEALRKILGTHVEQKGSLVADNLLRFDFSHFQKVTEEEIKQIEEMVNRNIRANLPLEEFRDIPIAEARAMGAIALFGEKYGEKVRVIKFGSSIEFCGGTHVGSTGEIGMFKIVSEGSVAAGVRRIEAYTGKRVEEFIYVLQQEAEEIKALLGNNGDVKANLERTLTENAELKKQIESFRREKENEAVKTLMAEAAQKGDIKVVKALLNLTPDSLKNIAFAVSRELKDDFLFVGGTVHGGKPQLIVMLGERLVAKGLKAGALVKEGATLIQGGGGGQPHFASAGGKNPDGLQGAIDKVISIVCP